MILDELIPGSICLIKKLSIRNKLGQRHMDMPWEFSRGWS